MDIIPDPTTIAVFAFAVIVSAKLLRDLLVTWGVIPDKRSNGVATAKTVGQLSIGGLKALIREEVTLVVEQEIKDPLVLLRHAVKEDTRAEIMPILTKMSEYHKTTCEAVQGLNLTFAKVSTLLEIVEQRTRNIASDHKDA